MVSLFFLIEKGFKKVMVVNPTTLRTGFLFCAFILYIMLNANEKE